MADEWEETTLGAEVDLLTGFPFKSERYTNSCDSIPLVRGDNIVQGTMRWDGVKRWPMTERREHQLYELREGDVVLAMDRPWIEAGLKYAAISKHDLPCLLVQRTARLRGGPKLDTRFLRYLVGSREFTQHIHAITTGTAVPHISGKQIKDFAFPLPPLAEQKAIASVLGALDDKIELNRRMNATLEALARALFESWFAMHANDVEESLVQELIDERVLLIGDGYRAKNSEFSPDGLPFIRAGNLKTDGLDLADAEVLSSRSVAAAGHKVGKVGDVAFTSKGTVGRITRVSPKTGQFVYSPQVCFWRSLAPGKLHPNVLYRWMSTDDFTSQVAAVSTQTDMAPYVSLQDQRKMVIQLPPASAQREIAQRLEPIDDRISANAEQSRTLATLRDTLLPKLLSGELSVPVALTTTEEALA